jgi:deoxyribonuclease V
VTDRPIPAEWLDPPDPAAARRAQTALAERVVREDAFGGEVRLLGGVDVSNNRFDPEGRVFAAVVALSLPDLRVVETAGATARAAMPYIPGLLGFREIPALLAAWEKLGTKPDLLLVDGHGVAHPRRLGIAAHLGVVLDVPAIGVAKSVLVGAEDPPLAEEAGAETPLVWRGERIGAALRTRRRANPLYVSVGHRVSLETAVAWVRRATGGYRLPEPTRQAHLAANAVRVAEAAGPG